MCACSPCTMIPPSSSDGFLRGVCGHCTIDGHALPLAQASWRRGGRPIAPHRPIVESGRCHKRGPHSCYFCSIHTTARSVWHARPETCIQPRLPAEPIWTALSATSPEKRPISPEHGQNGQFRNTWGHFRPGRIQFAIPGRLGRRMNNAFFVLTM